MPITNSGPRCPVLQSLCHYGKVDVNIRFSIGRRFLMISQTVEYALRAIVHLAAYPGAAQTNRQIAEATKVPMPYLSKVLQQMTRAGLIRSHRGLRGGFTLARRPDEITVFEVFEVVDP